MTRREIAMDYFEEGYNCSQAVALAFSDMVKIPKEQLLRLSSSFGGGMGRLREVCGAVTGMFIILGLLYGFENETGEEKAKHYKRVQDVASRFEKITGDIVCRNLLGLDTEREEPTPTPRTKEFYKKRPCKELVGVAAEILEEYISEQ